MTADGIKLTDFDCAFIRGYSGAQSMAITLKTESAAPELIELLQKDWSCKDKMSSEDMFAIQKKCDVFSFGVVLK